MNEEKVEQAEEKKEENQVKEQKRARFGIRGPLSEPMPGRFLCIEVPMADIESASGIKLTTHLTKDALVVVAVPKKREMMSITPGCIVEPFLPPQHDGGRTKIAFQEVVEFDKNGRFTYKVVWESELASFIRRENMMFDVTIIHPSDYKLPVKLDLILPNKEIILPS